MSLKIKYSLTKEDFLRNQIYVASKSERIKKKRRRSHVLVPILYLLFAIFLFMADAYNMSAAFMTIGVIWYFGYPTYSKRKYRKHYEQHITEHYKNRINKEVHLEITEENLLTHDYSGESKLKLDQFDSITKITSNYLLQHHADATLILPKTDSSGNTSSIELFVKQMAKQLDIEIDDQSDWEWK